MKFFFWLNILFFQILKEFQWMRGIDDEQINTYVTKTEKMLANLCEEEEGKNKVG